VSVLIKRRQEVGWQRIKKLFRKKKSRKDQVIGYRNGDICLKDVLPMEDLLNIKEKEFKDDSRQ